MTVRKTKILSRVSFTAILQLRGLIDLGKIERAETVNFLDFDGRSAEVEIDV